MKMNKQYSICSEKNCALRNTTNAFCPMISNGWRNPIIDEILKKTSLETRIKVANEMAFIDLICELGYRENKAWTDEENELLSKLMKLAKEHTDYLIKEFKQWEADGRPE